MYVLIITMIYSFGVAVTTQEFSSLETCKQAAYDVSNGGVSGRIKTKCVKK